MSRISSWAAFAFPYSTPTPPPPSWDDTDTGDGGMEYDASLFDLFFYTGPVSLEGLVP